ncbi:MAG: GAF domain-containing protein [Anaerolineales bacterium]|nr:GAF domain-containing protein [Anaerolineales bacterium]
MALPRHLPQWAKYAAFAVIALLVSAGILGLNQIIDRSRQGETLLTSAQALAYKISAAEWQMISEGTVALETEQILFKARLDMTQTLNQVLALYPRNADLLSASETLKIYLNFLNEETRLIKSGDIEGAKQLDEESVDPTFKLLEGFVISAQSSLRQRAQYTLMFTNIGFIFLIFAASSVIATLWASNEKVWIENLQTGVKNEALSQSVKHSEEMAVYAEMINNRNRQLVSASYVIRQASSIQEIAELMDTVVKLTAELFGYSHVGIYILNEQKNTAFLQAASSANGGQYAGQGFHIEPNRRNPLYLVVEENRRHIASDADGATYAPDASFPSTRSRMMLPLAIRGKVVGAFDIHSEKSEAFHAEDADILQTVADLVAVSLENLRLTNEMKTLASQLETNISFQTRETWSKLTSRHAPAYQYTPAGVRPIFSQKKSDDGDDGLKIPLTLHGQTIGNIKLRRKGVFASWSEHERELIEKIADQVSLALENSRLVDEAQKSAQRDQMIANVSSRVRETLDIESVIRTATTELRKVFDLKEAEISVGFPQLDEKNANPQRRQ